MTDRAATAGMVSLGRIPSHQRLQWSGYKAKALVLLILPELLPGSVPLL